MAHKYLVDRTEAEKEYLFNLIKKGKPSARKVARAHVLLRAADGWVNATVDRTALWHALTPQMFRLQILSRALEQALARGLLVTDDASAVEALGLAPRL